MGRWCGRAPKAANAASLDWLVSRLADADAITQSLNEATAHGIRQLWIGITRMTGVLQTHRSLASVLPGYLTYFCLLT